MYSEADILRAFEGLKTVPGSKKARKEPTELAEKRKERALAEPGAWDSSPIIRTVQGKPVELFTLGAFALALETTVQTLRLWERKGYIPIAPYRLKSKSLNGKKVNGNRAYPRIIIEITIEEFANRGLLGAARVEWNRHSDLTSTLLIRWKEATNRITE